MERRTYYFSGHVQGVGFRYTVKHLAATYPVTGFVRNLSDGRVECVVEGQSSDLTALAADIVRQMEGFIRKTHMTTDPATGEFHNFTIRP